MSKIALKPADTGSATFTLEAPATNTDRTFNLPDEAGTVLTNASDIESQVKTATNATGTAPVYACRAWVNFSGVGTVSIRESGNVSSITDNGTGDYTVNFTTAMPDANYAVSTAVNYRSTNTTISNNIVMAVGIKRTPTPLTSSSARVQVVKDLFNATSADDPDVISVSIFR